MFIIVALVGTSTFAFHTGAASLQLHSTRLSARAHLEPRALVAPISALPPPRSAISCSVSIRQTVSPSDDSELPAAVDTLKWRLWQLCVRVLALPMQLFTAVLALGSGILFAVSNVAMRAVVVLPGIAAQLVRAVVFVATYPIWLLARGVSALAQGMKMLATSSERYAALLVAQPGTNPSGSPPAARPRQAARRTAVPEPEAEQLSDPGKLLARQQMLERAKAAGGKPRYPPSLAPRSPATTGLTAEQIAEMRAKQPPIIRPGDAMPRASRIKPKPSDDVAAPSSPSAPPAPPATPVASPSSPKATLRTAVMPSTTLPATVGQAKAQLGGSAGTTVGNAKKGSGKNAGQNKWLWKGATTPTAQATSTPKEEDNAGKDSA